MGLRLATLFKSLRLHLRLRTNTTNSGRMRPHSTPVAVQVQGQPLLVAKGAPADAAGRLMLPFSGGSAVLPDLSVTGGEGLIQPERGTNRRI